MRSGSTALEVLLASALLAVSVLHISGLLQGTRRIAKLDAFHVLAQRRAQRAVAVLQGHPLSLLLANATGDPPGLSDPALSPQSREIFLPTFPDQTLEDLPPGTLDHHFRGSAARPLQAFLEELRPGYARLAILVTWVEPTSRSPRHLVWVEFLEDPFLWSSS